MRELDPSYRTLFTTLTLSTLLILTTVVGTLLASPKLFAQNNRAAPSSYGAGDPALHRSTVSAKDLETAIVEHISDIEELVFLREQASKLGVKVWIFGGAAAAYAHYCHWDLLRLAGDKNLHPLRFDFGYTNIFRPTQDVDIVVDGTVEQAAELQKIMSEKYNYKNGSKSAWEVRSLRMTDGKKLSLLEDKDFRLQHTDSNSTTMIEISISQKPPIRDLKKFNGVSTKFISDVLAWQISYDDSDHHLKNEAAKRGDNPEIFSVLRFLTKAFQYGLALKPEDLQKARAVIQRFKFDRDVNTAYSKSRIETLGVNLIRNAMDVERAMNVLEELGLKQILQKIGKPSTVGSVAWWADKEPLPSFPLGQGDGETAEAIGMKLF